MGNVARTNISKKNTYWIPHYRYLELLNFCRQYPEWKKRYISDNFITYNAEIKSIPNTNEVIRNTENIAISKQALFEKISLIESTADEADYFISSYILKGVTENISYDYMRVNMNITCCREKYYNSYRKFFWLLDKKKS